MHAELRHGTESGSVLLIVQKDTQANVYIHEELQSLETMGLCFKIVI